MPRPKGSKVIVCKCGSRVVAMPGTTVPCSGCKRTHTIPKAEKAPAKKVAQKAGKKPVKKVAKKK